MLTIIAETIDTYMIGVGVIFFQLITLHIFVRFLGGLE
jgi:Na+-transporting methylmalonyl-CoA/oxaloacetate decarboxylase gamma subunit